MPGLLRKTATCPECGRELIASFRTTNIKGTRYEYCHGDGSKPCQRWVKRSRQARYERNTYRPLHVIAGRELVKKRFPR